MTSVWKRLFGKAPEGPIVVERMSPMEVPVLTEVKRYIARGENALAIRYGYTTAIQDVTRAYGLKFPRELTNIEFLQWAMGPGTPLASQFDLFERAYRFYEPVRFGEGVPKSMDFLSTLTSIYASPPMFRLYASTAYPDGTPIPPPPPPSAPRP